MITMQLSVGHMFTLAIALGRAMYAEVQYFRKDPTRKPHVSLARDDIREILAANKAHRRDLIIQMRNATRSARRIHNAGGVL